MAHIIDNMIIQNMNSLIQPFNWTVTGGTDRTGVCMFVVNKRKLYQGSLGGLYKG